MILATLVVGAVVEPVDECFESGPSPGACAWVIRGVVVFALDCAFCILLKQTLMVTGGGSASLEA